MVQILEDFKMNPSASQRFADAFANLGQAGATQIPEFLMNRQKQAQQAEQLQNIVGKDISALDPDIQKAIVIESLRGQGKPSENAHLSTAMNAINTMESLLGKSGIGRLGSTFNWTDKARENRGVFEATQAALLPLFKSIFPRGMTQREFQHITEHYIPQASDTEANIRGKLKALKGFIGTGQLENMPMFEEEEVVEEKKKPSLKEFFG